MMRARFEPAPSAVDHVFNDTNADRVPLPTSRRLPPRAHKSARHIPPPAIGTRTLGRAAHKQPDLLKAHKEYGITLSTKPGHANINDAFLIVVEVVEESSSWNQGLRSRDLFINFGGLTRDQFLASGSNLQCLLPIIARSLHPLECAIIRGQRLFNISLRGMRWEHGVCLGAVINSYPEPVPLSQTGTVTSVPATKATDGFCFHDEKDLKPEQQCQDIDTMLERYLSMDSSTFPLP